MPYVATFALYGVNRGDARCFKLDGLLLEIFQVGVSLLRIVLEMDLGSIGDSLEVFSFEGFLGRLWGWTCPLPAGVVLDHIG